MTNIDLDLPRLTAAMSSPWYTKATPGADPISGTGQARAIPDHEVLTAAATVVTSRLPGVEKLARRDRVRLEQAGERMLAFLHQGASPRSAGSWLMAAIPAAPTDGLPAALGAAAEDAVREVERLLAAAAQPSPDPLILGGSPYLGALPAYPTRDQIADLRSRYGEKVVETVERVVAWDEADCTPDFKVIERRLALAESVALSGAVQPPLPGFKSVPSRRSTGTIVHRMIQERYVLDHPDSLVVADRRVLIEGRDVGGLSSVANKAEKLPNGYRDASTIQQLKFLDHSLRGGRRVQKRTDITDLTTKTVYEVKPRLSAPDGVTQLWEYLAGYNTSAQFIHRGGGIVPREDRLPYPYRPGLNCSNPHTISEGTWAPNPAVFLKVPRRPGMVVRVFTDQALPGLLLYDLFVPDSRRDDEGDSAQTSDSLFEDVIRALSEHGIPLLPPWIGPVPPAPPDDVDEDDDGDGRDEESEPEEPRWAPPSWDDLHPTIQVLIAILGLVLLLLLFAYVAKLLVAGLVALILTLAV